MSIVLTQLTTYATGIFDDGGAEIVDHDPATQRLFVTNGANDAVDVLAFDDNGGLVLDQSLDITDFGDGINSVAVKNGIVAVAVEVENADGTVTQPGKVVFFDTDGNPLGEVEAGVLPDMVTFTPDGSKVLVANEGELLAANGDEPLPPSDPDANDPEGSVSIIDIADGVANAGVQTATFAGFNDRKAALERDGVRLFDGATVAEDLEPEYITVADDGGTAFVTLQENNAVAVVDIATATVTDILGLGTKAHSERGNGFDGTTDNNAIDIEPQPTRGLYMPDAIADFTGEDGETYLITANEGDSRDFDEADIEDVTLDPLTFPDAETLQAEANLGGLEISTIDGDTDGDGDFDILQTFGARSFTIWDGNGNVVFDSGDALEKITATAIPRHFNADNDENEPEGRSDNKGPEPESVDVGMVAGTPYAFVGLERVGGIVVYELDNPANPSFVQYINPRDFDVPVDSPEAGDIGPEGIKFVGAADAPGDKPVLLVANEVSGTTTVYEVNVGQSDMVAKLAAGYLGRALSPADLDALNADLAAGGTTPSDLAGTLAARDEARQVNSYLADPTDDADAILQFLDTVYDNLFDRDIEQGGADFWTDQIQSRLAEGGSVDGVILDIISGAQGDDLQALNNRADASLFYSNTFAVSGKEWTFGDDVVDASDVIADVDATDASLADAKALAEQLIAADEVAVLGGGDSGMEAEAMA